MFSGWFSRLLRGLELSLEVSEVLIASLRRQIIQEVSYKKADGETTGYLQIQLVIDTQTHHPPFPFGSHSTIASSSTSALPQPASLFG